MAILYIHYRAGATQQRTFDSRECPVNTHLHLPCVYDANSPETILTALAHAHHSALQRGGGDCHDANYPLGDPIAFFSSFLLLPCAPHLRSPHPYRTPSSLQPPLSLSSFSSFRRE